MSLLEYLIIAVAAFRTAYFVTSESGPFLFMERIRSVTTLGGLLSCFKCATIWTALFMWLLWTTPFQPIVMVFAVSGGAMMLAAFTGVMHL